MTYLIKNVYFPTSSLALWVVWVIKKKRQSIRFFSATFLVVFFLIMAYTVYKPALFHLSENQVVYM